MSETRKTRVLIFIVAYNAQSTIEDVLDRIPDEVLDYDYEILIIDDCSDDSTFETAATHRKNKPDMNIRVLFNPENQGYGGNQKIGYQYAIRNGFDVVVLLHGDGQYAPEVMDELIRPVAAGEADAVFGTRMAKGREALKGGMPLYKYVGNRILTFFQNRMLGTGLSEFHSGYRAYSVQALASLPFQFNTNNFHFDTEIIIQLLVRKCRILEVPIPTYYGDEICRVNGLAYAWHVIGATIGVRLHQMQIYYRRQYDCASGDVKYPLKLGYRSSHTVAIDEVTPGARVLDIACGEGHLGKELEKKGCTVSGVDTGDVAGKCLLESFHAADLDTERVPFSPADFDFVLLLDIIEHLGTERQYELLDDLRVRCGIQKPTFLISTGNVAFILLRLQLLMGQFNYGKRGILDQTHRRLFTFGSLRQLLIQSGYRIEEILGIPVPFPAAIGDNLLARMMLWVNRVLIRILPGVFSYQIFLKARPLATVNHLLADAEERSRERHENMDNKTKGKK